MTEDERLKLKQSHGLTVGQMEELARKQAGMADDDTKKVTANNARKLKDRYFVEKGWGKYEIPEHEKHLFHIAQETRAFNGVTGEKLSQPRVQTYDEQTYEFMKRNRGFEGQTIFILHDPRRGTKREKEANEDEEKLVKPSLTAPANQPRFAETQLHAAEGTDANDPNAPASEQDVTSPDQEGVSPKGAKQAGGTEGVKTTQNTDTTPNDDWTVPELKEYARANDIDFASDDNKADILKKIRKASK